MAQKKKRKLKKKFKRVILFVVILIICIFVGKNVYEEAQYRKTTEYKLLDKGYEKEVIELIENKLDSKTIEKLLSEEKNDYIKDIIGDKYFMNKNFDAYLEYYAENSKKDFNEIVALVNVEATRDWYEDTIEADTSKGYAMLVNKFHYLPEDYDAGEIKKFSSTYAYGNVSAEAVVYDAFITMAKSAKEDDITLILTSGHRTYEKQKEIYDEMEEKKGKTYADEYAARPGHSEHETGLALDILTYNGVIDTFKETETYAWLKDNAFKYGFIERYPEGKEHLTGYAPESWHYRYVGVDLAKKIVEEGITFDEYYAFYLAE